MNFTEQSVLYKLYQENELKWFKMLSESVGPDIINQDNICCVNTALIMAIFADQAGKLYVYMDALLKKRNKDNKNLLIDLSNVLNIWNKYYLSKTKDSFSLEYTTNVPYCYF